ncbi:MAG: tyrosine-type recombinase/integrase [Acidobacteriota bacterium]
MRKFVCQPLPGDASDPQGLTALLDRYLLWLETHHYAPGTVKVRRVTLSHFLRWCLERSLTRPQPLTPEILERFQRHVYFYRQRNGQHLSLSSQSHRLTALRSWCAWLTKQRVLEQDPARDLVLPREEQRLPRHPLSVTEVEAVLAQADLTTPHGLRNRAILEVLYSTGLRRDEALALEHTDLDRQRGTLLVRRGKGKKDRFVPIGARALAWIDKYLAEARPLLARRAETPLLFVSKNGHRLHGNQLSKIVRDYLRGAGIAKPGACHLFRHTTATLMLEAGADVRYIQALLGCQLSHKACRLAA